MVLARNTGLILLHRKYRKYKKVFQSYVHLTAYKQLIRKPQEVQTNHLWAYWRIIIARKAKARKMI